MPPTQNNSSIELICLLVQTGLESLRSAAQMAVLKFSWLSLMTPGLDELVLDTVLGFEAWRPLLLKVCRQLSQTFLGFCGTGIFSMH